ncbi:hypothetical protein [Acinetobacter soli]|uniref:hypothetical protein n=1 Tax=Acinetobacter soli TaxID=487316 RepID=UPI003A8C8303
MKKTIIAISTLLSCSYIAAAQPKTASMSLADCKNGAELFGAIVTTEAKCKIEFKDDFKNSYSQITKSCIKQYGSKPMQNSVSNGIEQINYEIYNKGLRSTCDRAIEENSGYIK